jgi:hypothetical protein
MTTAETTPNAASRAAEGPVCACCGCDLRPGRRFVLGGVARCLRCCLHTSSLLRRSLTASLVVGTLLTAINQGTLIVHGQFPAALAWKVPLTYCVPFFVATWSALANSRR